MVKRVSEAVNIQEGATYFDNAFLDAFKKVITEFSKELVFNEYDFRANLYYYLRQQFESENKPYNINFDYTLPISSGPYGTEPIKPDIVVWNIKNERDVVCGELKFSGSKSIPQKDLLWDYNKLMKLKHQYEFQRAYFLCISKQSPEKLVFHLINRHIWSREGKLSLKRSSGWICGFLCILFHSVVENQGYKITFPNRVQITSFREENK
ncbi:MAG: hypothetical protein ACFE9L_18595 [Candidatus Hodarchaeota archaeon]